MAANWSDRRRVAELQVYADQSLPSSARQNVESAIASIGLNAKFRAERLPQISEWLAGKTQR
jgi:hypothetical protein